MKKNLFYAAFALAMMASCTNEDNLVVDPVEPTPEDKVAIELGINAPSVNATVGARSTGAVGDVAGTNNVWNGQQLYITMINQEDGKVTTVTDDEGTTKTVLAHDAYNYYAPTGVGSGTIKIFDKTGNFTTVSKNEYYPVKGTFDFIGWHLDDAEGATVNISEEGSTKTVTGITINGTQDIMGARTKEFTKENYEDSYTGSDFVEMIGWNYSARTARNGIKPILEFKHQLARLKFFVRAGSANTVKRTTLGTNDDAMYVTQIKATNMIDKIDMDLDGKVDGKPAVVTKAAANETEDSEFTLMSRNETASPYVMETLKPVAPTVVWADNNDVNYKGDQVGESIMFFPGEKSSKTVELAIALQQYVQIYGEANEQYDPTHWESRTQSTTLKVHASSVVIDDEGNKATAFEAGKSYNVYITVYGFEKIEVSAELTAWELGGDVNVDVEEGESKHAVDVKFEVQGLATGVTPTITVKQHAAGCDNTLNPTQEDEVTANEDNTYTVQSFSTLHYTVEAQGYNTVTGIVNAENGKTVTITMTEAQTPPATPTTKDVTINVTDGTSTIEADEIVIIEKNNNQATAVQAVDGKYPLEVGKTYTVTVTKAGYTQADNTEITVTAETAETLTVTMTQNQAPAEKVALTFIINDIPTTDPATTATITINDAETAYNHNDGAGTAIEVEKGSVTYTITTSDNKTTTATIDVQDAETITVSYTGFQTQG